MKIQLRDTNTNPEDIWLDIKKEDDEAGNYLLSNHNCIYNLGIYMFTIFCLLILRYGGYVGRRSKRRS